MSVFQPFAFMAGQESAPTPPGIITTGLRQHFDVLDTNSYPGTGTEWFDLISGTRKFDLIGGTSYTTVNGGSFYTDGGSNYLKQNYSSDIFFAPDTDFTIQFYMKLGPAMLSKGGEPVSKWSGSSAYYPFAIRWNNSAQNFRSPMYNVFACNPYAEANADLNFNWELYTIRVNFTALTVETILPGQGTAGQSGSGDITCLSGETIDTSQNPLSLMQRGNGSNRVEGWSQVFLIYDRAITDEEITHNYDYLLNR